MRFWDASALVPLCVREDATPAADDLLRSDPEVVVWWGTEVECLSAICHLRRDAHLTPTGETAAREALEELRTTWHEVLPTEAVRRHARRGVRVHGPRAADSLQLAAAEVWADGGGGRAFVTADRRLADAADADGFRVLLVAVPGA